MSKLPFSIDSHGGVDHADVEDEGCAEVGGETVLRDSRGVVGSGGEVVGVEARGDHVPAEEALESMIRNDKGTREKRKGS
jgi:hypothetical protein